MRIAAGLAVLRHRYASHRSHLRQHMDHAGLWLPRSGRRQSANISAANDFLCEIYLPERNGRFAEHADEPATVFVEVSEALLARCPLRSARTPGRQRQLRALAPCGIPGAQSAGSVLGDGRSGRRNGAWRRTEKRRLASRWARPVNVESRAARGQALWITRIVDQIPLRVDCSFAGEGLMAWCEAQLGRLLVRARPPRSPDRRHHRRADRSCKAQPARRFADFTGPCWAA